MIKKYLFLLTLLLISSIKTSSESCGFLIKELHYYIECGSTILDEDMEVIDTNEQDILHIRRGGYGELNKLTISSEETGFECVLNLEKFQNYRQEHGKVSIFWYARNENYVLGYDEVSTLSRIIIAKKNPQRNYNFYIKKVYQKIGVKKQKLEPVEISEFKEDFINWLKNDVEDDDNEEE